MKEKPAGLGTKPSVTQTKPSACLRALQEASGSAQHTPELFSPDLIPGHLSPERERESV